MSWISDLSANRFNNTYFRDAHGTGFAVDMSGDLVVREAASIGAAKHWVNSCLELRKPSGTAINLVYLGDGDGDKSWNIQQTSAGDTLSFGYTSEFNVYPYSNILNIDGTGTGKVGIGTTSPPTLLSLGTNEVTNGTRDLTWFQSYRHAGGFGIRNNDDLNNGILEFYWAGNPNYSGQNTVSASCLSLKHNGYVGIGTTNPSQKLTLVGNNSNADSNLVMEIAPGLTGGIGGSIIWRHSPYNDGSPQYFGAGIFDTWEHPRWVIFKYGVARAIEVEHNGQVIIEGSAYSDDRLKTNEVYITNALNTLLKLKPQIYNKHIQNFESDTFEITDNYRKESGIIAQEVFYDAPELRHLINIHPSVNIDDVSNNPIQSANDPQVDVDYSNWGPRAATVNYTGFIAYLIKGIQEQQEIIEAEKAKVATLESQLADVLTRLTALESA